MLIGGYYYQENCIIKTNHLDYTDQLNPPLTFTAFSTKLNIWYNEIDKPQLRCTTATLKLLPGSTTQAKWQFDPAYRRNFSVPDNIILTKQ